MLKRFMFTATVLALAGSSAALAGIDGLLDGDYGPALSVQNNGTGFGDNYSELDAFYCKSVGADYSFMFTGNLEGNGNGFVVFFDTRAGGAVASTNGDGSGVLGAFGGARVDDWGTDTDGGFGVNTPPGGGSVLDAGFNPDFAMEINAGGGGANYWINIIDMTVPNAPDQPTRDVFLGGGVTNGPSSTHVYSVNGGSVEHAFDNTNSAGVTDSDASGALTATTGFEFLLSSAFLDLDPGHSFKIMAFITNGGGDYLANQFLPGVGGGYGNLGGPGGDGGDPLFDSRLFAGDNFIVIPEPSSLALLALGLLALRRR